MAATVLGDATHPAWSARERLLVAACDELHDGACIGDSLWAELAAAFEPAALVEIVVLAGLYHMVSFVSRGFQLPLEPAAARFPHPPSH